MNIYNLLKGNITQQELLNHYNVDITYLELPSGINGFVYCYKSIFNIFINKHLPYCKRKTTILHELAHIELNQFNQLDNDLFTFKIDQYEDDVDEYIKRILEDVV